MPRLGGAIRRYALAHIGDSAVLKIAHRDHAAANCPKCRNRLLYRTAHALDMELAKAHPPIRLGTVARLPISSQLVGTLLSVLSSLSEKETRYVLYRVCRECLPEMPQGNNAICF